MLARPITLDWNFKFVSFFNSAFAVADFLTRIVAFCSSTATINPLPIDFCPFNPYQFLPTVPRFKATHRAHNATSEHAPTCSFASKVTPGEEVMYYFKVVHRRETPTRLRVEKHIQRGMQNLHPAIVGVEANHEEHAV
jgi:hypothetical protein